MFLTTEHHTKQIVNQINREELRYLQKEILKEVHIFCEKNNIEYFLFVGTLLGAVRHGGYIPWDDDIDICMKRADYNKFFETFNGYNDFYKAINCNTDKECTVAFGKVIDTRTILREDNNFNVDIGVYIDIFPMDNLPQDTKKLKQLNKKINIYRKMLLLKTISISTDRASWKNAILRIGGLVLKPIKTQFIIKRISKQAISFNDDENVGYIADISVLSYGEKEIFPIDFFDRAVDMEFEGDVFKAPEKYESVLTHLYGDYMELPPIEKRVSHHSFQAFWKD